MALHIRKDESITGLPTCPSCGGVLHGESRCPHCGASPSEKKEPLGPVHRQRRGDRRPGNRRGFLSLLFWIALIGALFLPVKAPTDYLAVAEGLWKRSSAPLSEEAPGLIEDVDSFKAMVQERIRKRGVDASEAAAAFPLADCLSKVAAARSDFAKKWTDAGAAGVDEIERAWQVEVSRFRSTCVAEGVSRLDRAMREGGRRATDKKATMPLWQWLYGSNVKPAIDSFHSKPATDAAPQQPRRCDTCMGTGLVKCSTCGGRGSVPATISTPCKQCDGTGIYKPRTSQRTSTCPFCKGAGKIESQGFEPCLACEGKGIVSCATCGGRGTVVHSSKK